MGGAERSLFKAKRELKTKSVGSQRAVYLKQLRLVGPNICSPPFHGIVS